MTKKIIINNCKLGESCILKVDDGYFGYDSDIAYPETIFKNKEKAYVFKKQGEALSITSWLNGEQFTLLPI